MPQLLVRNLEKAVVDRLREEAARQKISVEEAHRRVLRRALLPEAKEKTLSFKEYLLQMPLDEGGDDVFERVREPLRPPPDLDD